MRRECIEAVQKAMGRTITAMESKKIESRITEHKKLLASKDPKTWQALTEAQRLQQAADSAAQELVHEAFIKKVRLSQTIMASDRIDSYTTSQVSAGHDADRIEAISRMMAPRRDGHNNFRSVESESHGIRNLALSQLYDTWESIQPGFVKRMAGMRNLEAEKELLAALYGKSSRHGKMNEMAKKTHEVLDALRQRMNEAGGDIGKLEDYGLSQSWWSSKRLLRKGQDYVANKLARLTSNDKYVHEDGRPYTPQEKVAFMREAWMTIVTDGASKERSVTTGGFGLKANRHSQHRQIHFKDADSALEAFNEFSDKSVFQVIADHVSAMSRDIALLETFGPNSDLMVKTKLDQATQDAARTNPAASLEIEGKAARATRLYNHLAGNRSDIIHAPLFGHVLSKKLEGTKLEGLGKYELAEFGDDTRNLLRAASLQKVVLSMFSDIGLAHVTAHTNGLSHVKLFLNQVRSTLPSNRRLAARAGLINDVMADSINRFGTDMVGPRFTAKVASAVWRATGANLFQESGRAAYATSMADNIGSLTRRFEKLEDLHAEDHRLLKESGITPKDWEIWRAAKTTDWSGRGRDTVLTADAVLHAPGFSELDRHRAASRLLGFVQEERNVAIVTPGARVRSGAFSQSVRGTVLGEIGQHILMFKSFPIALFETHWNRAFKYYENLPSQAGYLAAMMASMTVLGSIGLSLADLLAGRDPRQFFGGERWNQNWLAAFLKGGGLGIYGDFLFNETGFHGRSLTATVAGPAGGFFEATDDLVRGNLFQYVRGEDTNIGAESVRFVKSYVPGFRLWYTEAAFNRLIFDELQEYFSPGYLSRQQHRASKLYDTTYWLPPGQGLQGARAPNFGKIVGQP